MNGASLVSIIIPHCQGREILFRCLSSLRQDDYQPVEILLIDNASTDGSVTAAAKAFANIQVIRSKTNLGFAGGCNLGMQFAHGQYFVLLNDDAVVTPGWLGRLIEYARRHENVAALQPKIKSLNDKNRFDYAGAAGGMIDIWGYPFARGRLFSAIEKDKGQYDDESTIFWASGTCTLLQRAAIQKVGYLDEAFFAHMEEIDLNWRLQLAGYQIRYLPEPVIYHNAGSTLKQESPQKVFLNHRNSLLMILKNYSILTLAWIFPVRILLEIAAIAFALIQLDFRQAFAIAKAVVVLPKFCRHIWLERKRIQNFRKLSDRQIMRNMFRKSIVVQFFILRKKTFASLRVEPFKSENG